MEQKGHYRFLCNVAPTRGRNLANRDLHTQLASLYPELDSSHEEARENRGRRYRRPEIFAVSEQKTAEQFQLADHDSN